MGRMYFEKVLNDFVSKYVVTQNIFPFLSKALWSRIDNWVIPCQNISKKLKSAPTNTKLIEIWHKCSPSWVRKVCQIILC